MKIILIMIVLCLFLLFGLNIHGIIGASLLGCIAAGTDFFWQLLRVFLTKSHSKSAILMISIGFLVRVISLFAFLKLAFWWLGENTNEFYVFCGLLVLLITIMSIVSGYKINRETE